VAANPANPLVVEESVGFVEPRMRSAQPGLRRRNIRARKGSYDAELVPEGPVRRRKSDPEPEPAVATLPMEPLVREWLQDQRILGRSPRTIGWYRQKLSWYLANGGAQTLDALTAAELKRFVGECQDRGLTDESVRGHFSSIRAFANWAKREGYPVAEATLHVRAPKVAQKEMETFSQAQIDAILGVVRQGWGSMAVQLLLGTGMRVGEMCALRLEDLEDDGETAFLKVQRGKGSKFRRTPASPRLRRELGRYVNRLRPVSASDQLLLLRNGRPITVGGTQELMKRIARRVGFRVNAHKFRHTFATEYLRRGGDIERLRKILGHETYFMVMRYVHLDKGDLARDFAERSPF
jgi:site-specific recombinase XerD